MGESRKVNPPSIAVRKASASAKVGQSPNRGRVESPTMKTLRKLTTDSLATKLAREAAESPFLKLAREAAESPFTKLAREAAESPFLKAAREAAESPMLKALRDMESSPAMQTYRQAVEHADRYAKLSAIQMERLNAITEAWRRATESWHNDTVRTAALRAAFSPSPVLKMAEDTLAWHRKLSAPILTDTVWQRVNALVAQDEAAKRRFAALADHFPKFDSAFHELRDTLKTAERAIEASVPNVSVEALEAEPLSAHLERAEHEAANDGVSHPFLSAAYWNSLPVALQIFLLSFLIPLIVELIGSTYEQMIARHAAAKTDAERTQVVINIQQELGDLAEGKLRTVVPTTLRVRSEPSTRSPVVARLPRGTLVTVLEVDSAWARIRYPIRDSQDLATGWVAVGRLRKLEMMSE